MPTSCQHFAFLQRRVDELGRKFVNDQVAAELASPTMFVPDLDQLAAYRLLVHAELEDFLEAKAKEGIKTIEGAIASETTWVRYYPGLSALIILLDRSSVKVDFEEQKSFEKYVTDLLSVAKKRVKENNGIKASSFLFLSFCAGKSSDEIDYFLLGSLSSYGKARGDVAHQSVTRSISLQAPSAELITISKLIQQLALYFDVCS